VVSGDLVALATSQAAESVLFSHHGGDENGRRGDVAGISLVVPFSPGGDERRAGSRQRYALWKK